MNGELDMRKMGGLRHKLRITHATFFIATLAISGVPMFAGFFSKDEILAGAYEGPLGQTWLYWLGTLTAGLTAFYMFRALCLTFWGESRVEPETAHHLHESGSEMTGPLLILAFFSIIGGYLSWPRAWGGGEAFDRYLEPVFGPAEEALRAANTHNPGSLSDGALMTFSVLAAGIGIGLGIWWYWKSTDIPRKLAQRFAGLHEVLIHKYYIDEFYNWLIVHPIHIISEKFLWRVVDAGAIDGVMVNGAGEAAGEVGSVLRRIQSGNIRSYAAWVLLGAVLWLLYVLVIH
jgi:NADH-quinone oxidoreductase subunit L